MEKERLKDIVLIFLVAFFSFIIMDAVGVILEPFIESTLLTKIIQIAVGALVFGFLLLKVMVLFKGEEYRELLKRTRKSRYTAFLIVFPLVILLWIIQSRIIDPLLGSVLWKSVSTIVFIFILLMIAILVSRKSKKEWEEFKQQSS